MAEKRRLKLSMGQMLVEGGRIAESCAQGTLSLADGPETLKVTDLSRGLV